MLSGILLSGTAFSQAGEPFGSCRHLTDDFRYPDFTQHIGVVAADDDRRLSGPDRIMRQSYSEEQAMHRASHGGWFAFHTHDPTHRTQPADSPAGDRIAFTVFGYRPQFWRVDAATW